MSRKVLTTVAVMTGLVALSSVTIPSVTSAATPPATNSGRFAPAATDVARPGPWTFEGKADLNDSGSLELKIRSTAGVPRAFDLVRRLLVGRDVLLVNTGVPAVDVNGRRVALSRLNDAILRVRGTLLPAGQWRYDVDGEATPTVRMSRIVVLGLDF